jgi:hypothetical protein
MIEICAGQARERAEARQGLTPQRSFDDENACHRNAYTTLFVIACQPRYRCRRVEMPPEHWERVSQTSSAMTSASIRTVETSKTPSQ